MTLLGPTGIGKTRLIAEYAGSLWRGRTLFADLSTVRAPDGLSASLPRSVPRRGRTLVILDGADAVASELGRFVEAWLGEAPAARFVITSARRPGLGMERCVEVGPLPPGEAVSLLLERAARIGADARWGADRQAVSELIDRLGGNPLALELAAARARVLRPRQIVARLDAGLEVLGGTGEGRHASMAEAIDGMWAPLAPGLALLLERCAVFAGGFSPEAAEAVLLDGGDAGFGPAPAGGFLKDRGVSHVRDARSREPIEPDGVGAAPATEDGSRRRGARLRGLLDDLGELRDHSLLGFEDGRYFVPEPIRTHALRKLETRGAEVRHEARLRHAAWCVALISERPGDDEAVVHASGERENLLAAHVFGVAHEPGIGARAALALARILAVHGQPEAEAQILRDGIEAAREEGDPALLARLLRERAMLSLRLGTLEDARLDLDECERIGRATGDRAIEIQAGVEQGRLRFAAGDFETSQVLLSRGIAQLEVLEAGGHRDARFLLGYTHNLLGMVREAQGRLDESARCFEEALGTFRRIGNRRFAALASMNLGVVRFAAGRLDDATQLFEQAVAGSREVGNRAGEADAIVNLGSVLLSTGSLGEAERLLSLGLELERDLGNRRAESLALGNLGVLAFQRGDLRTAEERLRAAVDSARKAGEKNFHALYLAFHGAAVASLGERARAEADFETARAWFEGLGDPGHLATVRVLESFLHLEVEAEREGRLGAARALLEAGGPTGRSAGARLALRLLERAIGQRRGDPVRSKAAPRAGKGGAGVIEIGPDASWFRLAKVTSDLGRRAKPRRLLRLLVERRLSAPGVGVPVEQLADAGWPGDRAPADVVANRVYVAVNTLRALGLGPVLLRRDDGYLLDPSVPVRRLD